jgi:flagellar hook-length control protein FliK
VTDGKNVGLHIQATDERAKKILEESISHLKDSMASQSLSLNTVDFSIGRSQVSGAGDQRQGQFSQQPGQGMFKDMLGQNAGGNQSGREAWDGVDSGSGSVRNGNSGMGESRLAGAPMRARNAYASGRLDVRA